MPGLRSVDLFERVPANRCEAKAGARLLFALFRCCHFRWFTAIGLLIIGANPWAQFTARIAAKMISTLNRTGSSLTRIMNCR
jgi:hypothetical protein